MWMLVKKNGLKNLGLTCIDHFFGNFGIPVESDIVVGLVLLQNRLQIDIVADIKLAQIQVGLFLERPSRLAVALLD